jgi:hypothetical protein
LLVFLIGYWSALIFLVGQVDKPDEGKGSQGEERRHDEWHALDDADGEESPLFLGIRLLWLGLWGVRDIEGDVLGGIILIAHLLNGL